MVCFYAFFSNSFRAVKILPYRINHALFTLPNGTKIYSITYWTIWYEHIHIKFTKKKNERKLKRRRRRKKKIKKKRRSQIKKILFSNAVNFNSNICLFMYRMIIMNSWIINTLFSFCCFTFYCECVSVSANVWFRFSHLHVRLHIKRSCHKMCFCACVYICIYRHQQTHNHQAVLCF